MPQTSDSEQCQHNLQRAWTEQLHAEFTTICYHFKVRLATPVICVESLASNWGEWRPDTRTLTINRRLIEEYPWDVVLEILKHEMAHQLVSEMAWGGRPHGAAFIEACERLGVCDWARQASGELPREIPNWRLRQLSDDEERLLKKAEKLLALAASTNEHEAALAMQRVRQLYAKYNLEQLEHKKPSNHVYTVICSKQKKISSEDMLIFSILTQHFFVQAIYLSHYDAQLATHFKAVEILGTPQNVVMAEYVYYFLRNQLQLLWRAFQKHSAVSGRERRTYMLGLLAGFRDKLAVTASTAEVGASVSSNYKGLMALHDQHLKAFVHERHPRLGTRRGGSVDRSSSTYSAGVTDGGHISLHRGVTQQDGNRGLRLGANT